MRVAGTKRKWRELTADGRVSPKRIGLLADVALFHLLPTVPAERVAPTVTSNCPSASTVQIGPMRKDRSLSTARLRPAAT